MIELFEILPEYLQKPFSTLLFIVVGYMIAKIFSGIIFRLVPPGKTDQSETVYPPLNKRLAKFCFWLLWYIPCLIAINYIFLPSFGISLTYTKRSDLLIAMLGYVCFSVTIFGEIYSLE